LGHVNIEIHDTVVSEVHFRERHTAEGPRQARDTSPPSIFRARLTVARRAQLSPRGRFDGSDVSRVPCTLPWEWTPAWAGEIVMLFSERDLHGDSDWCRTWLVGCPGSPMGEATDAQRQRHVGVPIDNMPVPVETLRWARLTRSFLPRIHQPTTAAPPVPRRRRRRQLTGA
jgi:hypothetical protein